jgi:hypothetical protein
MFCFHFAKNSCNALGRCYNAALCVFLNGSKNMTTNQITALDGLSVKKNRTSVSNDPTHSDWVKRRLPMGKMYAEPFIKKGFVYFRINPSNGSIPVGRRTENWTYLHNDYKNHQKLRISNDAFDLRFETKKLEIDPSIRFERIQEELEKIATPFDVSRDDSEYLGLFFDGTSNFSIQSETNVYELCNCYLGNKFYYGGVGNSVENKFAQVRSATARGFDFNIRRAISDIHEYVKQKKRQPKIQLAGFSRGAAQANELAKRLKDEFEIDLLLMMDPVYSLGVPGQGSNMVPLGKSHNYVETDITDNVRKVIVLYAEHETRVWFPATKFTFDKNQTTFVAGLSPGNHCDVGGYWERNGAGIRL